MISENNDAKNMFHKKGSCSRTFFFIICREYGIEYDAEEQAFDPLAGGILQSGYQCGMLWGVSGAVGAKCFRDYDSENETVEVTVATTRRVIDSFVSKNGSAECSEITRTDFKNFFQMVRYILFRARNCFNMAQRWAPKACAAVEEGISAKPTNIGADSLSCASVTANKMGATKEQAAIVAGFAGGLGLSGGACGALGAAVWMRALKIIQDNPEKKLSYSQINSAVKPILNKFRQATNGEFLCREIVGREFENIHDHTTYLKKGGCEKLIEALTEE